MRTLPHSLDPVVVAEIDDRLARSAEEFDVTIPWAIESGSRAWGFPSPDSDYDCRFLYVRKPETYVSLWPVRDVIETPLDKIFDVNGWDLAKAVQLVVKGNATVTEWLRSPIIYSGNEAFRDGLLQLAVNTVNPALVARHYLHVGRYQWNAEAAEVPIKRHFYALRSAASLRWIVVNPGGGIPPMDLPTLLEQCDPPADVLADTNDLIARKAVTRELGTGAIVPSIGRFILEQYEIGQRLYEGADSSVTADATARATEYFRSAIVEFG
ncbi:nucleotidyltransferase domain-containing protein [Glaciihabitans arcticus]|uniref:Nucleotidyltransferase domain-containing protein n=1 Tax=Glaciihabitans arcticus TaxID=2668039 RepID=A0A4Q9GQQ7_9MICO|nr:nucleotidyltransferase domain-containing protein [Glaciihabitans arcticus]TBN57212.1 nucleotidyltransferase domain-containing protein [Glaciihabitans arcticus]